MKLAHRSISLSLPPSLPPFLPPSSLSCFLLTLCGFYIMHSNPTYPPVPSPLPSALVTPPKNKTNFKSIAKKLSNKPKPKKQKRRKNLSVDTIVWLSESHSMLLSLYVYTCQCSLHWIVGLTFTTLWILGPSLASSWMPCCCRMSWRPSTQHYFCSPKCEQKSQRVSVQTESRASGSFYKSQVINLNNLEAVGSHMCVHSLFIKVS